MQSQPVLAPSEPQQDRQRQLLEQQRQIQYYHNHILNCGLVYVAQLGAHVRWGGRIRVATAYNTAHLRGSTAFYSKHNSILDTKGSYCVEVASDAYDEGDFEVTCDGQVLSVVRDPARARAIMEKHLFADTPFSQSPNGVDSDALNFAVNLDGTELWQSLAALAVDGEYTGNNEQILQTKIKPDVSSVLQNPHVVSFHPFMHAPPRPIADGLSQPNRAYGMPTQRTLPGIPGVEYESGDSFIRTPVYEMINCPRQPPMRHGHAMFVRRGFVFVFGGFLTNPGAVNDDSDLELCPLYFDLSRRDWVSLNKEWIQFEPSAPDHHALRAHADAAEESSGEEAEGFNADDAVTAEEALMGVTTEPKAQAHATKPVEELGSRLFRPAYCQMSRHSADDEAVCFMYGGARTLPVDRTLDGRLPLTDLRREVLIGWLFSEEKPSSVDTGPSKALFHWEALPLLPGADEPDPELGQFQAYLDEKDPPSPSNEDPERTRGAFLVVTNRLPPPSFAQYCRMRRDEACGGQRSAAWEVLHLFKSNGEVWALPITAEGLFTRSLRWRRLAKHYGLPCSLATRANAAWKLEVQADGEELLIPEELEADITDSDALQAEVSSYIQNTLSRLTLIGVAPRSLFSHNLVPDDLYPSRCAATSPTDLSSRLGPPLSGFTFEACGVPPMGMGMGMGGMGMGMGLSGMGMGMGMGMGSSMASFTPSRSLWPGRDSAMQANTEFILVVKRNKMRDTRVTTFIPGLGYSVNENMRVRLPLDAIPYNISVVTPHFIRPRPPPSVNPPPSDSRFILDANTDTRPSSATPDPLIIYNRGTGIITRKRLINMPDPRIFSAHVNAVRAKGNKVEDGEPYSSYLGRSPQTLKELVAQVAIRFFPSHSAMMEAVKARLGNSDDSDDRPFIKIDD